MIAEVGGGVKGVAIEREILRPKVELNTSGRIGG